MAMVPASGVSIPAIMLKSVLLPHPLGPITVTNSPAPTDRSMEVSVSSACRPRWNVFDMPCASNFGVSISIAPSPQQEHEKNRSPDDGGCGVCWTGLLWYADAASLRWYYPDQVHRVSSAPVAPASQ